jgi:modulator of drug activity B
MANILLINGHQPFPTSPGRLTGAFVSRAETRLAADGHICRTTHVAKGWDIEAEVDNQLWADLIILQFPLNSMGTPWSLKKYLDEVYTAGMDGRLAKGDGRTRSDPTRQYGSGGRMHDTSYMLSVTMNAPSAAFGDPKMDLFGDQSVDQLLSPVHINFAFFGLVARPTFTVFDVNKNPSIEADFARFETHLQNVVASI